MKCIKCGQVNDDNHCYCLRCGNKLTSNNNTNSFQENKQKKLIKTLACSLIVIIAFIFLSATITSDISFYNTSNNTQYYSQLTTQDNITNYTYVGNNNSYKFHYSYCPSAQSISQDHLVYFQSRQDAIQQGYHPCGNCNP